MKIITITVCLLMPFFIFCTAAMPQTTEPQSNGIEYMKPPLSQSQNIRWAQLVGTWFGDQPTKDGGRYMWISNRYNDGTYKAHFRITDASGKKMEKIEVGEWGVAGDIEFLIYKGDLQGDKVVNVDPTDPNNRDVYKILKLNDEIYEYELIDSDIKFTAKRVPVDFSFPE
ncbi:exported hypothetical protein [Syntrophobacter sp. SbD1]|nr:exported hypothetical protein [Syntrophobacter sp. SbD1]